MHLRLRPLLFATGALLLTTANAFAQFIELVTEAQVTLQATFTTTSTVTTATQRITTPSTSALRQADIIKELLVATVSPDEPVTDWKLVAVHYAPADLAYINGEFNLYLVKGNTRVPVPSSKFSSAAFGAVEKYKERNLGRYVLSSAGTVTNHVSYGYLPAFTVTPTGGAATRYTLTDSTTDGFASIAYATKDSSDGYTVSFYAISSLRATNRGSFQATTQVGNGPSASTQGLISLNLTLGAAKLVPASNYPMVSIFPGVPAGL